MINLSFCIRFSCGGGNVKGSSSQQAAGQKMCHGRAAAGSGSIGSQVKWELRPGGMLVQKREDQSYSEELITIRVSTVSQWHDISIEATSAFGELKMILSLVTGLQPGEQRLLFKGKERDDREHLHMVGVRDGDKVLLLQDPASKEMKLHPLGPTCSRTISV